MKCGCCRDTSADNYERIKPENNLFEILKTLNPLRAYNHKHSYFCSVCINLATTKLSQIVSTMSDQNANGCTLNVSTVSNVTNTSESSKDEYDYMVMSKYVFSDTGTPMQIPQNRSRSKRPSKDTEKPCPKRFKKPLVPIQLATVQQTSSKQKSSDSISENETSLVQLKSSQRKSSDSISENEMLLRVEQTAPSMSIRPCPKRFKNSSVPIHMATIRESSAEDNSLQPQSSESISANEMLLNVEHEASPESSASVVAQSPTPLQQDLDSLSSKDTPNQPAVIPDVQSNQPTTKSRPKAVRTQSTVRNKPRHETLVQNDSDSISSDELVTAKSRPKAVRTQSTVTNKRRPKTLVQYDSDSSEEPDSPIRQIAEKTNNRQQRSTVQDAIPGPSAPAAKNPRIRQDLPRDLRQYFSTQNFDVNTYSRSLAG